MSLINEPYELLRLHLDQLDQRARRAIHFQTINWIYKLHSCSHYYSLDSQLLIQNQDWNTLLKLTLW
jgi:hypothetical protein